MKARDSKIPICIALESDVRRDLDAIAQQEDRSRSWVAGRAIAEYIARRGAEAAQPEGDAPC